MAQMTKSDVKIHQEKIIKLNLIGVVGPSMVAMLAPPFERCLSRSRIWNWRATGLRTLLSNLARVFPFILTSYNQADDRTSEPGVTRDTWINVFTRAQMESVFWRAGLRIEQRRALAMQTLWLLRSQAIQSSAVSG
ncbi:hypothetical protein CWB41_04165 [Methylovirgula ligni]|nr:hypothetical protein CWB41_04165 [Methylovirgula ligni]